MKRRDALKNIGLTAGLIIATPSVISLLNSCNTNPNNWNPTFLNKDQASMLMNLIDVIIPKTDTPSASEVNVVEFLDYYILLQSNHRQSLVWHKHRSHLLYPWLN